MFVGIHTVYKSSQQHDLAAAILSYFKVHRPPRLLKPASSAAPRFQIIHTGKETAGERKKWRRAIQNSSPERRKLAACLPAGSGGYVLFY
jgi:hypothetical protein